MQKIKHIKVTPYEPSWPRIFEEESHLIQTALGNNGLQTHHIGSTSVPGLTSKPTIDMHKPACLFEGCLSDPRLVWVAFIGDRLAGYITLQWQSLYPPFNGPKYPRGYGFKRTAYLRTMGIGSLLLATAEKEAASKSQIIGVGLYAGKDGGYGAAQSLRPKILPGKHFGKGVSWPCPIRTLSL